jgi:hypothetical protein
MLPPPRERAFEFEEPTMDGPADPGGSSSPGDPPEIPFNPLVKKILGDSDPPADVVQLVGYVSPSKQDGNVRLYRGLDLQEYYEIPRSGVVCVEPIDSRDDDSPTRLLVKSGTPLELIRITRISGEASFLEGCIARSILPGDFAGEARVSVRNTKFLLRSNPPRKCH